MGLVASGKSIEAIAQALGTTVADAQARIAANPDLAGLYQKMNDALNEPQPAKNAPPEAQQTPPSMEPPTTRDTEHPPSVPPAAAAAAPAAPPAAPAAPAVAGGVRRRAKPAAAATPTGVQAEVSVSQPSSPASAGPGQPVAQEARRLSMTATITVTDPEDDQHYAAIGRLYAAARAIGLTLEDLVVLAHRTFPVNPKTTGDRL